MRSLEFCEFNHLLPTVKFCCKLITNDGEDRKAVAGCPRIERQSDHVAGRGKAIFQLEALFLELVINCLYLVENGGETPGTSRNIYLKPLQLCCLTG